MCWGTIFFSVGMWYCLLQFQQITRKIRIAIDPQFTRDSLALTPINPLKLPEKTSTDSVYLAVEYSLGKKVGLMPATSGFCEQENSNCSHMRVSQSHARPPVVMVGLDGWAASEFNMGMYACPLTECHIRKHAAGKTDYNLLLSAMPPRQALSGKANRRQTVRHAELSMESSINHPSVLDASSYSKNGIDLVVSFRPPVGSEVVKWLPTSYINTELRAFLTQNVDDNRWLSFEHRDAAMVVMISNCDQKHVKRIDIVNSITKLFPRVYTLGACFVSSAELPAEMKRCLDLPRRSAMWDAPKECLLHHAMFSFSLENSFELAYVTEKLWQPLKMGAIPVYSTGSVPENRKFLPHPDAALLIEDFASLGHLAAYMHSVAKNKSLWFKHAMAWRSLSNEHLSRDFLYAVNNSLVTLPCRLCDWWSQNSAEFTQLASGKLNSCTKEILDRVRFPAQLPAIDKRYGIDAIFVIHYKPLKHRKLTARDRVKTVFGRHPVFIEDLDKNELSDTDLTCVSNRTMQLQFIQRPTHKGEDSLTLKHMAVFHFIAERGLTNVLVLEDDATFLQSDWLSPSSQWQLLLKHLPSDYDLVMLSSLANFHRRGKQISKHLYLAQQSRVSSMYLVSRKGALNMLRTFPIVGPFDFQINYATNHAVPSTLPRPPIQDIKVLWSEPPMSDQFDSMGTMQTVRA
jgi:GR25 family glycosyltransferase involved in LPS biosynthesis